MIEIKNLNKYYNKTLHVLKDINISLPDTGLISIVGESGSGKTTLLHAIGGIDKYEGEINYNGKTYKGYNLDLFRQNNIGFIFQNYLLFEDLTIYENLEFCLRVIGIKDKEEVNKRIEYVLKQVGMFKYRKKLARNLSGGQQQRVSIARALIKNTKIVLADEPTGNLDRKNTIEIMNILKHISKTTLVLLVTHNKEMANIYSDLILNISDGVINNQELSKTTSVSSYTDDTIYLEDYKEKSIKENNINLALYGDISDINIKIIFKDNRYYLVSDKEINVIKSSNIKEKREEISVEELSQTEFDSSWYSDSVKTNRSISSFKEIFKSFFSKTRKRDKFLNISFFSLGILLAIFVVFFFKAILITEDITYYEDKYLIYNTDEDSYLSFSDYVEINDYITNYAGYNSTIILVSPDASFETSSTYYYIDTMFLSDLNEDDLIAGSLENIVISTTLAEDLFDTTDYDSLIGKYLDIYTMDYMIPIGGIVKDSIDCCYLDDDLYIELVFYKSYIDEYLTTLYVDDYDYNVVEEDLDINSANYQVYVLDSSDYEIGYEFYNFVVVGKISIDDFSLSYIDSNEVVFFANYDELVFYNSWYKQSLFKLIDDVSYNIVSGREPNSLGEILAPINSEYQIGDTLASTNALQTITVVGLYEAEYSETGYSLLLSKETLLLYYFIDTSWYNTYHLFDVLDKTSIETYLEENCPNFELISHKDYMEMLAIAENEASIKTYGILALLTLVVYIVLVFFVIRTKVIADSYDIAVYRAIGASKLSFYIKYIKETVVITLLTTTLGYIICFSIYALINYFFSSLFSYNFFRVDFISFMVGLLLIYAINIIISAIPVAFYLRKSPAELVAKYDM